MTKFIVSYYQRNPLDPQDRYTVKRDTLQADTKQEAGDIMAACDCEIIEVKTLDEPFQRIAELEAEVKNLNEGAHLLYMYPMVGEEKLLRDWQLNAIAEEADAKDWQNQTTELRSGIG